MIEFEEMEIVITNGDRTLEWEYIGEGLSGDYNPDDPDDYPHLRFSVYEGEGIEREQLEHGSYCTRLHINTPQEILESFGRHILEDLIGDKDGGYKRDVESATWFTIDDLET